MNANRAPRNSIRLYAKYLLTPPGSLQEEHLHLRQETGEKIPKNEHGRGRTPDHVHFSDILQKKRE
jgi:hypothetical protein